MLYLLAAYKWEEIEMVEMRLLENAHLLRYPYPSSLWRTSVYASFLGISEALHLDIFHQPLRSRFFDSLN
jgi:hypothetical protein